MDTNSRTRLSILLLGLMLCAILVPGSIVDAKTPPLHGREKPAEFAIHLPWEPGASSDLDYNSYGEVDHSGLDYYAIDFNLDGGTVYPAASGVVVWENKDKAEISGYGKVVFVEHKPQFPGYVSLYAHLASIDVQEGDSVTLSTPLGVEGQSGGQSTPHLHFAMRYCSNVQVGQYPKDNCSEAVVPEPILGEDVYEGLGWWHQLKPNKTLEAATRPAGDSVAPTGQWGANATSDGARITSGSPIVFDVDYTDAGTGVGEIRLTAYYHGWAESNNLVDFDPFQVWRIIARCNPDKARPFSGCTATHWQYVWNPYTSFGVPDTLFGLLPVPWLPKAVPVSGSAPVDVCISFDIFDRAGNPLYAPGGTRCNFLAENSVVLNRDATTTLSNQPRLVQVMPVSTPSSDNAAFISDVTLPDGTVVSPDQALTKIWRVRNTGTSTWDSGYQLVFTGGEQMGAPTAVDVPGPVSPGAEVDLSVPMTAPSAPGTHRGDWRLRNAQGVSFGEGLWVIVQISDDDAPTPPPPPSGSSVALSCLDCPATVQPGQTFRPTIRAQVNSGQLLKSRGDLLRNTDGNLYGVWPHIAVEQDVNTGSTYDFTFYADNPLHAPDQEGTYETKWRVWRDGHWDGDEIAIRFTVQQSGGNNYPPNPPNLTGPGDWAIFQGNPVILTAQHNGDPDGDAITGYYFELLGPNPGNSGWIGSNTWNPTGLPYSNYEWRVKVRDSRGAESGWSPQTWHFNVLNNNAEIYEFYHTTCRDAWGGPEKICFCAKTNAGTLQLQVNTATDGSDSGEWRIINELGVPEYRCIDDNDRPPNTHNLEWESGTHRVRLYARREGGWANAAYRDITFSLPAERRPDSPWTLLPANEAYLNSRTVRFDWKDTWRTTELRLEVATDATYSARLVDRRFPVGTSEYVHTFDSDHGSLYWRVAAIGPYGTNGGEGAGAILHIDRDPPSSAVTALSAVTTDTAFPVRWGGSDARSGLRWYDVEFRDGPRGEWVTWMGETTLTSALFRGEPGHTYYFRCRAMDQVGNWEAYSAGDGDTGTRVDPTAVPPESWWSDLYGLKRNIVILNNDGNTMPAHYPVRLHFDSSTTPTAADIYNASQSAAKGDDVRIVYNNVTELHRWLQTFSSTEVNVWFPLYADLSGGQTSEGQYQMYYGNPSAASPLANLNSIFVPQADANTVGLWHFQEGSGGVVHDSSGRGHNGSFASSEWTMAGKFGYAGLFNGASGLVDFGHPSDFDVGHVTLEGWINLAAHQPWSMPGVLAKESAYYLEIIDGRFLHFTAQRAGNNGCGVSSWQQLPFDTWAHFAATYDGLKARVYINGELNGQVDCPGVLATNSVNLLAGYVNRPAWLAGKLQHLRVSNIARTEFPYARVVADPAVAAGEAFAQPAAGSPDLALQSLTTFPSTTGGVIVQAVVRNEGAASTTNGFYTDLYADHQPTGPGDYTDSLRFWVASPIASSATVTLTSVLTEVSSIADLLSEPLGPGAESTATLYAQADSDGVVTEPDEGDNVSPGTEMCLASPDLYEYDNDSSHAKTIAIGEIQHRNFDSMLDSDFVKFEAQAGQTYVFETGSLGPAADTRLALGRSMPSLWDPLVVVFAENDDSGGSLASRIEYTFSTAGTYYIIVHQWNPYIGGCGTGYSLTVKQASSQRIHLPLMLKSSDS